MAEHEPDTGALVRGPVKGLVNWALGTVASVALAAGLGAHALLWSYDVRISRVEDRQTSAVQSYEDLRNELRQMRSRLEQVLDELRRRP